MTNTTKTKDPLEFVMTGFKKPVVLDIRLQTKTKCGRPMLVMRDRYDRPFWRRKFCYVGVPEHHPLFTYLDNPCIHYSFFRNGLCTQSLADVVKENKLGPSPIYMGIFLNQRAKHQWFGFECLNREENDRSYLFSAEQIAKAINQMGWGHYLILPSRDKNEDALKAEAMSGPEDAGVFGILRDYLIEQGDPLGDVL